DQPAEPAAAAAEPEKAEQNASAEESASTVIADPGTDEAEAAAPQRTTATDPSTAPEGPASTATADPSTTSEAASAAETPPEQQASNTAAAEQTVSASKFEPELLRLVSEAQDVSDAERAALTAFYQGRGDDLLWVADGKF